MTLDRIAPAASQDRGRNPAANTASAVCARPRRIALALGLAVAWATVSSAVFSAEPELAAEQIVARNEAARGGVEAWRKIETMVWVGHIESADAQVPNLQFVLEQKRPNKSRFEMKSPKQTTVRVFDGTQGWKTHPVRGGGEPELQPFTADEVRFARAAFGIEGPLLDRETKGLAITLDGVEQVDGRKAYRLNVRPPFGESHHVWVDAETFLDVKYDRTSRSPAGLAAQITVYYRDYKTVEGLQIPGVIETGIGAAKPNDRMVIEKIALNPSLDDRLFAKPAASDGKKAARRTHRSGVPSVQDGQLPAKQE